MRNITCEHCWTHLPPEKRKGNALRDEIRNYFSNQEQARRQLEEAMPIEDAAKILRQPGAIKSLADFILGPNELSKEAAALSARLNSGQDPFSIHLPYTKAFMEDSWQPVGWTDYSERLDKAFQLLEHIAVIAHDRLGDTPLFWAVLGPIHDTLHHDAQHGFRQEIRRSEYLVLRKRVAEGRADMWDYWMLLHHESETDRVYVCDEMIDHALAASGVELEAFFEALDDEREDLGNRMPEIELPNPDRLWRQILERPQPSTLRDRPRGNQESAVSVRLLGRGGLYFWTTSTQHYGPSLMLAALGIALEGDLLLRFHDLDIPPFLPFWTGAKVAAEEGHWIFARDCFHRALLDIRLFASGLTTEGWHRAVEEYRFDLSFVDELFLRFGDEPIPQLHVALYFAIESLQAADVAEDAVIRLKFEHLGRRHKVQILGDVIRLSGALGERLWSRLEDKTREILVEAEAAWRMLREQGTNDFSAVGLNYRRAIEYEWHRRIGEFIAPLVPRQSKPPSVGQMLRAIRDCTATAMGREMLRKIVSGNSRFFDPLFVQRAIDISDMSLNEAVHEHGLGRRDCDRLRIILIEHGVLSDLLQSAQPDNG